MKHTTVLIVMCIATLASCEKQTHDVEHHDHDHKSHQSHDHAYEYDQRGYVKEVKTASDTSAKYTETGELATKANTRMGGLELPQDGKKRKFVSAEGDRTHVQIMNDDGTVEKEVYQGKYLVSRFDSVGMRTDYTRDDQGRVIRFTLPNDAAVEITYDQNGQRSFTHIDSDGKRTATEDDAMKKIWGFE